MKTNRKKEKLLKGRRGFFKDAAMGAGGLALVSGSLASCETSTSDGHNPELAPGELEVLNGALPETFDTDNWSAPQEIDFTPKPGMKKNTLRTVVGDLEIENIFNLYVNPTPKPSDPNKKQISIFNYNGAIPGPSFRLRGDQNLSVKLINTLSGNNGTWANSSKARVVKTDKRWPKVEDWKIDEHLYGPHQQHTTNLHTHGLHVSPGIDTPSQDAAQYSIHSDNVLLRVIPHEDAAKREKYGPPLKDNEQAGVALYNFRLKQPDGTPHFPGTHWYHPHPHGATFDQVASGMAGFIIVEGPADDYLKELYASNGYEEAPLLLQRVITAPPKAAEENDESNADSLDDILKNKGNEQKLTIVKQLVNGLFVTNDGVAPPSRHVLPNQVFRLRILNGSVDGQGSMRIMILKDNKDDPNSPEPLDPLADMYSSANCINDKGLMPKNASSYGKRWCTDENLEDKICLNNIAYDGIFLFNEDGTYTSFAAEWLTLGVANRADFLVSVPEDAQEGDSYTVWGLYMSEVADRTPETRPQALRIATAHVVAGDPYPAPKKKADGSLDIDWVYQGKPLMAEDILKPISDEEVTIQSNEEETSAYLPQDPKTLDGKDFSWGASNNQGKVRARRVMYTGFGTATISASTWIVRDDPRDDRINAMLIDGKKYGADTPHGEAWDVAQHKMLLDTAEEWTLYNYSMTIHPKEAGGDTTDPNNYHYGLSAYQLGVNKPDVRAVHHPFHIHQNPFYVRSVQDNRGNELLPLDEQGKPIPRWMDTVYIPHNGGRVIFRSRFTTYTGKFVNHCHLLQHEDWGMMQAVEVVDGKADTANYIPLPAEEAFKQNVFPALSLNQMYTFNLGKVKDTVSQKSLRMLCFDPNSGSYFDQIHLTSLEAKKEGDSDKEGALKIPLPGKDSPFPSWNNDVFQDEEVS